MPRRFQNTGCAGRYRWRMHARTNSDCYLFKKAAEVPRLTTSLRPGVGCPHSVRDRPARQARRNTGVVVTGRGVLGVFVLLVMPRAFS
eukprot:15359313-Alexandrium_andersonii.AAC.1